MRGAAGNAFISRRFSSISRVGPPPPSPYPKAIRRGGIASGFAALLPLLIRLRSPPLRSFCLKLVHVPSTSPGVALALYVLAWGLPCSGVGLKCVSTRVPSRPCHQKVSYGKRLYWLQPILIVKKYSSPASLISCGKAHA